ncbi:hypothetical protein [Streptomyces sp. NPDC056480]|uniref:hypothetical protein n=1 Tax=Streptomyces sp. NPDC056480 TaxID=3345833 RepID=UPI0036914CAE
MSVYTPQQSQPQAQQAYYGQQMSAPSFWGMQPQSQPFGHQPQGRSAPQQPFETQGQQLPLLVRELSLCCSAVVMSAVVEQLRKDTQILMGIQAQGQIPPHAVGQVLTECARRIAPIMHTALMQTSGRGQAGQSQAHGLFGSFPGIQLPQSQAGQFHGPAHGQGMSGIQPQYGQLPVLGM